MTGLQESGGFYNEQLNNLDRKKLLNEFNEYIKQETPLDFYVTKGEIEIDNIGGFSDGVYKLKNYEIQSIDKNNNLYIFKGDFKLIKKRYLSYNSKIQFTFHYTNGDELIIKYKNHFYKIPTHNKIYIEKRKGRIRRKTEIIPINIDDLKITIKFKRN